MFAQDIMQLSIGYFFGSGSASLGITGYKWRVGRTIVSVKSTVATEQILSKLQGIARPTSCHCYTFC